MGAGATVTHTQRWSHVCAGAGAGATGTHTHMATALCGSSATRNVTVPPVLQAPSSPNQLPANRLYTSSLLLLTVCHETHWGGNV